MTTRLFSGSAAAISAGVGAVLVLTAMVLPRLSGWVVRVSWPPLHADWDPGFGWRALPAIILGFVLVWVLPRWSSTWSLRAVMTLTYVATWTWTMALAFTEGPAGLARVFERKGEYLYDAAHAGSVSTTLHEFISRIPLDAVDNWHIHVAGHPPGALLFFMLLVRLGITSPFWVGFVVVTLGSTASVAVLTTLRLLASEAVVRAAVPWLVLAPTAVWMGVSGDAVFSAVAAWGLTLLALSATRPRLRVPAGLGAGVLLGFCVYLSYGLTLMAIVAVAVLLITRTARPLPWALLGSLTVAGAFTLAGFAWWEAYPVLVERYYAGIASHRPYAYWVWADVAAWTFTVGLATWAAFPRALAAAGRRMPLGEDRAVFARLALAALAAILAATLSGMSKAEVERIWLPFSIWIVALPLLLPASWHRPLLASQVVLALGVQLLLLTRW